MLEQALYFGVCLIPVCRNFKGTLQAAVAPVLRGCSAFGNKPNQWFSVVCDHDRFTFHGGADKLGKLSLCLSYANSHAS